MLFLALFCFCKVMLLAFVDTASNDIKYLNIKNSIMSFVQMQFYR